MALHSSIFLLVFFTNCFLTRAWHPLGYYSFNSMLMEEDETDVTKPPSRQNGNSETRIPNVADNDPHFGMLPGTEYVLKAPNVLTIESKAILLNFTILCDPPSFAIEWSYKKEEDSMWVWKTEPIVPRNHQCTSTLELRHLSPNTTYVVRAKPVPKNSRTSKIPFWREIRIRTSTVQGNQDRLFSENHEGRNVHPNRNSSDDSSQVIFEDEDKEYGDAYESSVLESNFDKNFTDINILESFSAGDTNNQSSTRDKEEEKPAEDDVILSLLEVGRWWIAIIFFAVICLLAFTFFIGYRCGRKMLHISKQDGNATYDCKERCRQDVSSTTDSDGYQIVLEPKLRSRKSSNDFYDHLDRTLSLTRGSSSLSGNVSATLLMLSSNQQTKCQRDPMTFSPLSFPKSASLHSPYLEPKRFPKDDMGIWTEMKLQKFQLPSAAQNVINGSGERELYVSMNGSSAN